MYDLTIRNLEDNDTFEIYSLIGLNIEPSTPFKIDSGDSKKIRTKN